MQSDFTPNYTIEYSDNLRTLSTHLKSGQTVITDAPVDNNGKGEAFSPTDLLATSLVTCVMTILAITCNNGDAEIVNMSAEVKKVMASNPRRVDRVWAKIKVELKGGNSKEAERLERAARACPVAKSLSPELQQQIEFEWKY